MYNIYKSEGSLDERLNDLVEKVDACCADINKLNLKIIELNKMEEIRANVSKCPKCGNLNPEGVKFCGGCGNDLTVIQEDMQNDKATAVCQECGAENISGAKFCSSCGSEIKIVEEPKNSVLNVCIACGMENTESAKFCCNCGNALGKTEIFAVEEKKAKICSERGVENAEGAKFCSGCGSAFNG